MATQTEASLEEFAAAWVQVHTDACEATSVRGEQSEALLDLRMACLHESRTELGAVVDVLTTGDAEVLARAHHAVAGLSPLSRCADLEALQEGATGPSAAEAEPVDRVRALIAKSNAQNKAGRFEDAKNTMNAATTMAEVIDYRPLQTELMLAQSVVESNLGNHLAAQAALRRVLSLGMPQRQWSLVRRAATDLISLVGRELGLPEQGLQYRELAAGLARNDPDALSDLHLHVGLALQTAGQYAESEIEYRAALAMIESRPNAKPQHIASARAYIANALHRQGNFELAAAEQRAVLSIRLEQFGPNHPSVASTRSDLAMALVRLERYDEAAPEAALALQIRVAALGPDHPMTGEAYNNMGVLNLRRGDATAAAAAFRAGLEIHERGLNPEHPKLLTDRANLASALLGSGDYQGAGDIFRTLIPLQQKAMGDEHPLVAVTTQNLAVSLYSLGRFDEAITEYQRALAIQIKALGEQHPKVAMIRTNLADALWQYDRTDEALEVAKLAWARRQQTDIPAAKRASTAFLLARITLAAQPKNLAEARALALLAQQAAPEGDAELRDGIAGWLAEHG